MKFLFLILLLSVPSTSIAFMPKWTPAEARAWRQKNKKAILEQAWKTYLDTDRRIDETMRVTTNQLNEIRVAEKKRPLNYSELRQMTKILRHRLESIADIIAELNVRVSTLEDYFACDYMYGY